MTTKKKPEKTTYHLKLRTAKDKSFSSVWLIARAGAADACLLHGEVTPKVAEMLAELFKLPIEREEWLFEKVDPQPAPGCIDIPTQQSLFEDVA